MCSFSILLTNVRMWMFSFWVKVIFFPSTFQPLSAGRWHLIICILTVSSWKEKKDSSQRIGCTIFKTSLVHFKIPRCTISPSVCSLHSGVEPLFRRGVLGRASKAFIMGFAALYYAGKHRATHAWPLTSLWSSATDERRGGVRLLIWFNIAVRGKVGDRIKNEDKRDEGRRKMGSKATLFFFNFSASACLQFVD